MKIAEYQLQVQRTMLNPRRYFDLANYAMGLTGEAGEVIEIVKKHIFHKHDLDRNKLAEEIGDVCWYIAAICSYTGLSLAEIMQANIDKLKRRYPAGFDPQKSRERKEGDKQGK